MDTPVSSVTGTLAIGQATLPGTSSVISGRLSRQSDVPSDRYSLGTALIQSQNGATESVIEPYARSAGRMEHQNIHNAI